jgi:2-polyprenyl-3-methyl-5-hydroxy-6-metoxy-1,4-benzoquinol methylase
LVPQYPDGARDEIAALVPGSVAHLLDVGCARGGFGNAMTERGVEVWGIEVDEVSAAVARHRLANVIVGSYPEALPEGIIFDCITFNDVLEHMVNPAQALIAARSHLTDSGYVVASIPNVRHASIIVPLVLGGRWDYQDLGPLDRTHLRWFTKATIRELFEENGFSVERLEPINWTSLRGKARLLQVLGRYREEFVAEQYAVLARRK